MKGHFSLQTDKSKRFSASHSKKWKRFIHVYCIGLVSEKKVEDVKGHSKRTQTHALSPLILFQQKSQKGFDRGGIITQGRSPCPHKRNTVDKKEE